MTEFRSSAEFSRRWISDYDFFHLDLKEGKVIKDSNGNVVTAVRLD